MIIQNPLLTGSLSYNGADLSNVTSSNANSASVSLILTSVSSSNQQLSASYIALSASYNVFSGSASTRITVDSASLQQVSSSQQQVSASLLTLTASYTALSSSYISLSASYNTFSGSASTRITANSSSIQQVSSSQQQISASLLNVVANYATTGSNSFRANQSITGSLVVSSTITAQTLVVQTVTSSIVYSSGSNLFGSALGDRQTFTGSLNITGSGPHAIFGNVGIGVISPASKLEINGFGTPNSIMTQPIIAAYATNGFNLGSDGTNALIGVSNSGTDMVFLKRVGGEYSEAMRITSTGAVGIGVTPSVWYSSNSYTALQVGNASLFGRNSANSELYLSANAYDNATGNATYITTSSATRYRMNTGIHAWFTAPSGTANATIAFTQSMTLTAASNLGIGYSNPDAFVASSGYGNLVVGSGTGAQGMTIFGGTTGQSGLMFADATSGPGAYTGYVLYSHSTDKMELATGGGTPRVTITSDGVKFQNGATSLNYYEEGTFTPTNVSQTFSSSTVVFGKYVRIGNQVTVNCKWTVTSGGTGKKALVFNLPFAFDITSSNGFTGAVSNYNEGASVYSSNVGTSVRNTSGSGTQQYVEAVYTASNTDTTLIFSMTYFTF